MKLAVKKEQGHIPGGGFHYMLHPIGMNSDNEAEIFKLMGHVIIEVPEEKGKELIKAAFSALNHQCEIAVLTDAAEKV